MRKKFADILLNEMKKNENIVVLIGDVGFGVFDKLKSEFPERVINPGSSEQLIVGMAVGLSLEGKIPIIYSITPFILYRPFEFIRNYVNHEKIHVKIVGSGRDKDYGAAGFTHYANDDIEIMQNFENIVLLKPENIDEEIIKDFIYSEKPSYLNLTR